MAMQASYVCRKRHIRPHIGDTIMSYRDSRHRNEQIDIRNTTVVAFQRLDMALYHVSSQVSPDHPYICGLNAPWLIVDLYATAAHARAHPPTHTRHYHDLDCPLQSCLSADPCQSAKPFARFYQLGKSLHRPKPGVLAVLSYDVAGSCICLQQAFPRSCRLPFDVPRPFYVST